MYATVIDLAVPLLAGLGLGAFYFGGLWWTMRALPGSSHPALLVIASYFGRMAVAFAVFLLVALGGSWERLVACLAGFLLVKLLMIFRLGPERDSPGTGLKVGLGGAGHTLPEVEDGNHS